METLQNMYQPWEKKWGAVAKKDQRPFPKGEQINFRFDQSDLARDSHDFKRYSSRICKIADTPPAGKSHENKSFGLHAVYKEKNRPNQHEAAARLYKVHSLIKFQGHSKFSKPGDILINELKFYGPARYLKDYFLGAQEIERDKKPDLGGDFRDYYKSGYKKTGHDPDRETKAAEWRRFFIRCNPITGPFINDIGGVKGGIAPLPIRIPIPFTKSIETGTRKYIPLDKFRVRFNPLGKLALALAIPYVALNGVPNVEFGNVFKGDDAQIQQSQPAPQRSGPSTDYDLDMYNKKDGDISPQFNDGGNDAQPLPKSQYDLDMYNKDKDEPLPDTLDFDSASIQMEYKADPSQDKVYNDFNTSTSYASLNLDANSSVTLDSSVYDFDDAEVEFDTDIENDIA